MFFRYTILYVDDVPQQMDLYERGFGLEPTFLHPSNEYGEFATGETRGVRDRVRGGPGRRREHLHARTRGWLRARPTSSRGSVGATHIVRRRPQRGVLDRDLLAGRGSVVAGRAKHPEHFVRSLA